MSKEYNPQADVMEEIERLEVKIKELIHKRDATKDPQEKKLFQQELEELEADLKTLQRKLD